jgi:hypothetical protein
MSTPNTNDESLVNEITPHEHEQAFAKVPWDMILKLRLDLENIQLFLERSNSLPHVKEAFDIASEQLAKFGGKLSR